MRVRHILKLKVSGLGEVFDDIKSLNPQKDEQTKEYVNKLNG